MTTKLPHLGKAIVISKPEAGKLPPLPDTNYRAVHQIRLAAISHNFSCVEAAATRQRCSVIVVVKADGYGHGAIETAIHLADHMGADAFAVATLEEGIALRKAFDSTRPASLSSSNTTNKPKPIMTTADGQSSCSASSSVAMSVHAQSRSSLRPSQIRIIVLGPPVGFPRCFDDYYHHGIELSCSGPEVAKALVEWISDDKERKRTQVERAANDAKAAALSARPTSRDAVSHGPPKNNVTTTTTLTQKVNGITAATNGSADEKKTNSTNGKVVESAILSDATVISIAPVYKEPTLNATLGNVSGQDLAKEVRAYLVAQQAAKDAANEISQNANNKQNGSSGDTVSTATHTTNSADTKLLQNQQHNGGFINTAPVKVQVFGGIEAVAKHSRTRQLVEARANGIFREDSNASDDTAPTNSAISTTTGIPTTGAAVKPIVMTRKRLRYHILVDSGMGRLGFKTQPVEVSEVGVRRDTVEIVSELVEMEVMGAPIGKFVGSSVLCYVFDGAHVYSPLSEFFGMCTHMADANSTSTYTNDQMIKFKRLLSRVRGADISIPTVSTDNSAALLTTNLKHFDPKTLLSQPHVDTRGFVRIGGAIYGQRPAFTQLRAVSTLLASVRHVAVLKEGESVGYDRAYVAPHAVRIATLTIGFADGYPRDLGNGVGKVAIRGHLFPVAGNVCM
jgi:alanine racemase